MYLPVLTSNLTRCFTGMPARLPQFDIIADSVRGLLGRFQADGVINNGFVAVKTPPPLNGQKQAPYLAMTVDIRSSRNGRQISIQTMIPLLDWQMPQAMRDQIMSDLQTARATRGL